ncbi:hypothetical protein [Dickeya sp. CFBP 2040]|nr:hypothetical protein [Dickeya sp. CFBP 2040]
MKNEAVAAWFLANTGTYSRIVVTDTANAHNFLAVAVNRQKTNNNSNQLW